MHRMKSLYHVIIPRNQHFFPPPPKSEAKQNFLAFSRPMEQNGRYLNDLLFNFFQLNDSELEVKHFSRDFSWVSTTPGCLNIKKTSGKSRVSFFQCVFTGGFWGFDAFFRGAGFWHTKNSPLILGFVMAKLQFGWKHVGMVKQFHGKM